MSGKSYEYKAEMKQLLDLIVHSLYTNKDVFLRELISNSSDALNKLRFKRLTDNDINSPEAELEVRIEVDKEKRTFTIEDTGIGMSKDDLINRIGTIASSGTLEFLEQVKEEGKKVDSELIGKFGVGFYSVFMVTDEITIETQHADKSEKAQRWVSKGEDTFSIEDSERDKRGTKISFELSEDNAEYADPETVKSIIKKYSNFVEFPVFVNGEKVNTIQAIWQRPKDEVKEEELNEFYKFISNDFSDPMGHLHLSIEGNVNFKALVYVPANAPNRMFDPNNEKTLHLYTNRVFIQDDNKDLLPEYLRFLSGVVDTEDLPLNVSREVTQNSPLIAKIRSILTSKILAMFEEWANEDKGKYLKFYKNFGSYLKTGLTSDFTNKSKLTDLLRFETSLTKDDEYITLKDYVGRMKDDQEEIYYILSENKDKLNNNPNLEYFKKNELEVLYLTDPVDVFTMPYLFEYDGKPIKSIDKADIDLDDNKKDEKESDQTEQTKGDILAKFKEILGDKVEDVKRSKRLVDSVATLVSGKDSLDPQYEKMMEMMDQQYTPTKKILEINTDHPLIKNLNKIMIADSDDPKLKMTIEQVFDGALLISGRMSNPNDFVKRMSEFMVDATKV